MFSVDWHHRTGAEPLPPDGGACYCGSGAGRASKERTTLAGEWRAEQPALYHTLQASAGDGLHRRKRLTGCRKEGGTGSVCFLGKYAWGGICLPGAIWDMPG